jgi:hypothetical protein
LLKEAQTLGKVSQSQLDGQQWGNSNGTGNSSENAIYKDAIFSEKLKEVCGYMQYGYTPLSGNTLTPISDGQRVFVWTSKRSVHAFDLTGSILWQNALPAESVPKGRGLAGWSSDCDQFNSPLIVDGKLVMHMYQHLWAYDLSTGKLAWKTPQSITHTHGVGTPTILRLKGPGAAGKTDAFALLWTGDLVRIRDGKMLQKSVVFPAYGSTTTDGADILFVTPDSFFGGSQELQIDNGVKNGKIVETRALRFAYEGPETVVWKDVWKIPDLKIYAYPVFHEGRIYTCNGAILDSQTGKLLQDQSKNNYVLPKNEPHGFIMAGEYSYCIPREKSRNIGVVCDVKKKDQSFRSKVEMLEEDPKDPLKRAQRVAMAGWLVIREWDSWHTPYNHPFPAGNRLYIRTFDHLYCFGGKSQAVVPSKKIEENKP